MVRQKNARLCHDSPALTSHFPASRSPTRVSVLSKTRVPGPTVPEAASSANRSRDTRSIASPSRYSTGAVVHELHAQDALQLLHATHQRIDRAARDSGRAFVDADKQELVVSKIPAGRQRDAMGGPLVDKRVGLRQDTRRLSSGDSGRSAAKIHNRASEGS